MSVRINNTRRALRKNADGFWKDLGSNLSSFAKDNPELTRALALGGATALAGGLGAKLLGSDNAALWGLGLGSLVGGGDYFLNKNPQYVPKGMYGLYNITPGPESGGEDPGAGALDSDADRKKQLADLDTKRMQESTMNEIDADSAEDNLQAEEAAAERAASLPEYRQAKRNKTMSTGQENRLRNIIASPAERAAVAAGDKAAVAEANKVAEEVKANWEAKAKAAIPSLRAADTEAADLYSTPAVTERLTPTTQRAVAEAIRQGGLNARAYTEIGKFLEQNGAPPAIVAEFKQSPAEFLAKYPKLLPVMEAQWNSAVTGLGVNPDILKSKDPNITALRQALIDPKKAALEAKLKELNAGRDLIGYNPTEARVVNEVNRLLGQWDKANGLRPMPATYRGTPEQWKKAEIARYARNRAAAEKRIREQVIAALESQDFAREKAIMDEARALGLDPESFRMRYTGVDPKEKRR